MKYPSRFLLIGACNPYTGTNTKNSKKRLILSAPLWDRFGLIVWVPPLKPDELMDFDPQKQEGSQNIRERVIRAWEIQEKRFRNIQIGLNNASMRPEDIKQFCNFTENASVLLRNATVSLSLTGRTYDHVLRVSRTIADLSESELILI